MLGPFGRSLGDPSLIVTVFVPSLAVCAQACHSASHIDVISFLFQSELSEKSNVASRLSGDFKKCFKSYPTHYPRLVLASRRCARIGVRFSPVEAQIPVCIQYMDLVPVNTETNNKLDLIRQT